MKTVLFLLISIQCFSQTIREADSILNIVDPSNVSYMEAAIKALNISKLRGYEPGQARALHKIGYMYFILGNLPKATEKYLEAASITKRTGDKERESKIYINLAAVYNKVNRFQESISYSHRALDLTDNDTLKAWVYNYLADGYISIKDTHRGIFFFRLALGLNKVINRRDVVINLNNIAHAFYSIEEYETSLIYLNEVTSYTLDGLVLARNFDFKACCFQKLESDSSEFYFQRSILQYPTASAFLNYAEFLHQNGKTRLAREKLQIAIGLKPDLKQLSSTLLSLGDLKNSLIVRDCLEVKTTTDYEQLCKESLNVAQVEKELQIRDNEKLAIANTELEKKLDAISHIFWTVVFVVSALVTYTHIKYFWPKEEKKEPFIFFRESNPKSRP